MQVKAEARYLRTSPQKARLVIDLIRGQKAGEAIHILRAVNKRIAPSIEKVLRSAIANAENRHNDVDVDQLIVTEAYVNEGPRMKRIRAAPGWDSPRPGGRVGSPSRTTPNSCARIWNSRTRCATG
jgi:large subunit ribosomal protein L22